MRLALAQIDTTVGDLDGNRERILSGLADAKAAGADVVLFPELAITGYPPEDLLLRPSFVHAAPPERAEALVSHFSAALERVGVTVATGRFRSHMVVEIHNDGPVTILLERNFGENKGD